MRPLTPERLLEEIPSRHPDLTVWGCDPGPSIGWMCGGQVTEDKDKLFGVTVNYAREELRKSVADMWSEVRAAEYRSTPVTLGAIQQITIGVDIVEDK